MTNGSDFLTNDRRSWIFAPAEADARASKFRSHEGSTLPWLIEPKPPPWVLKMSWANSSKLVFCWRFGHLQMEQPSFEDGQRRFQELKWSRSALASRGNKEQTGTILSSTGVLHLILFPLAKQQTNNKHKIPTPSHQCLYHMEHNAQPPSLSVACWCWVRKPTFQDLACADLPQEYVAPEKICSSRPVIQRENWTHSTSWKHVDEQNYSRCCGRKPFRLVLLHQTFFVALNVCLVICPWCHVLCLINRVCRFCLRFRPTSPRQSSNGFSISRQCGPKHNLEYETHDILSFKRRIAPKENEHIEKKTVEFDLYSELAWNKHKPGAVIPTIPVRISVQRHVVRHFPGTKDSKCSRPTTPQHWSTSTKKVLLSSLLAAQITVNPASKAKVRKFRFCRSKDYQAVGLRKYVFQMESIKVLHSLLYSVNLCKLFMNSGSCVSIAVPSTITVAACRPMRSTSRYPIAWGLHK